MRIWSFNDKNSKLEEESFIIYESKLPILSIKKLNDILLMKNENEIIIGKLENGEFEEFKRVDLEIGNFDIKCLKNIEEKNMYYLLIGNEEVRRGKKEIFF